MASAKITSDKPMSSMQRDALEIMAAQIEQAHPNKPIRIHVSDGEVRATVSEYDDGEE